MSKAVTSIKEAMKNESVSMYALAKTMNVTEQNINNLLKRGKDVRMSTWVNISKVIGYGISVMDPEDKSSVLLKADMNPCEFLKICMDSKGITQMDLAGRVHCSKQNVSQLLMSNGMYANSFIDYAEAMGYEVNMVKLETAK